MSNTKRLKRTLTTSALLGTFALAACAEKRGAQSTTTVTPASATTTTRTPPGPERVRELQREHNLLVDLVNGAGRPTIQWDVSRLDKYREYLDRLEQNEVEIGKLDAIYAEEMRQSGHAARIAAKRADLDQIYAVTTR